MCTQGAQQRSEDVNVIIEINRTHPQGKEKALQSRCSFSYTGLHVALSRHAHPMTKSPPVRLYCSISSISHLQVHTPFSVYLNNNQLHVHVLLVKTQTHCS